MLRRERIVLSLSLAVLSAVAAACGPSDDAAASDPAADDLPVGDLSAGDLKADGNWGAALTCKPIPELPPLVAPRIVVSIDGLTLHLTDDATGYDKVFPIGPGAIEHDERALEYGESHTMYPVLATGQHDFTLRPAQASSCKTWWTDPDTGQKLPVFAGLPFMPFYGGYAIHGPIDNYRAANGGNLRRGYVSHGCVRMEAADVLEVYGRIRKAKTVPVHVQREPERRADGTRVELSPAWLGAECDGDGDCDFAGGFCHENAIGGRGFCSARCTGYCPDKPGAPTSTCVPDPDAAGQGMCAAKELAQDEACRPFDHLTAHTLPRFAHAGQTVRACTPGSRGWIGDRCLADGDCQTGNHCEAGMCTQACAKVCPDQPGAPWTFCAQDGLVAGLATCLRQCTPGSNASECPAGFACETRARPGQPASTRSVCVPE
jgi:hypothetical protein